MGFSGVQNFPGVGLLGAVIGENRETSGPGCDPETEMIRTTSDTDIP